MFMLKFRSRYNVVFNMFIFGFNFVRVYKFLHALLTYRQSILPCLHLIQNNVVWHTSDKLFLFCVCIYCVRTQCDPRFLPAKNFGVWCT